jgi:O-acetyl-ADP-ribose deacetylase (regulator of RNase III)/uncharacterized protein with GYD domain
MATYFLFLNWTEQGIRNIKDSPKRLEAAKKAIKEIGGDVKGFYMLQGTHDAVIIADVPSDDKLAGFLLKIGSLGNVRTTTARAYTEDEYRKIIGGLGWTVVAKTSLQIEVVQGSILEATVEAIVNAANSLGIMGGGVAGAIKRAAGPQVEEEARGQAPIPVGHAVVTSGGLTRFKAIIHAPTMSRPAMRIHADNVALATRAALAAADSAGIGSIAIPGMGTGVGAVAVNDAAALMTRELLAFQPRQLRSVVLVDIDREMVEAWRLALRAVRREAWGVRSKIVTKIVLCALRLTPHP